VTGRSGVDEEYASLVRDVGPSLRRLVYARTGSWAAAEDVVQDALSDAHRRWDVIGAYDRPAAWARRAVLNRSASWHRSRGRERRALERVAARDAVPPAADEPALADDDLWAAIRALSDRQAEVVLLLWFEDLSASEVAATLGCAEDTVRTHWRRARSHLAEALGETDDEEDRG
jgi:RNA polymerase sigma factor (sigma-70 family)